MTFLRIKSFSSLILLMTLLSTGALAGNPERSKDFLERNFPNPFHDPKHTPTEMQALLTQALDSVIQRLEIPYEKDGKIESKGYFQHLRDSIHKMDPSAEVYLSGGVVRS